LIQSQGGDFHLDPAGRTYPTTSTTYMGAARPPANYIPFVISLYNVEKDEALYPLNLMVNPTDIQYGQVKSVQNAYTRKGWVTTYWGSQLRTMTVSGSSAGFYYNPNKVRETVEGLRVQNVGLTNYSRRNSIGFANLLTLISFFKRNGAWFLSATGDQTYWRDGTSRVIHVMDFVMVSYDGADHVGSFSTFTIDDNASNPYRISYNFEFVVAGLRGDFFDGHLHKADNADDPKVEVSIQGDNMGLVKTARMNVKELNKDFAITELIPPMLNNPQTGKPSYTLADAGLDKSSSTYQVGQAFVFNAEGGYNPNDMGQAGNYGVRQEVYDNYRKSLGLPSKPVQQMTKDEASTIYKSQYWDATGCANLPPQLAVVYFDACVNTGPKQATKDLQRALGLPVDGSMGPATIQAAQAANQTAAAQAYLDTRRQFYTGLAVSNPQKYASSYSSWSARMNRLTVYVGSMNA